MTNVSIPNTVTSWPGGAFFYCTNLTSVSLPSGVTSIAEGEFGDCYSLASVTIPNTVTNIGTDAFQECIALTNIELPTSVTTIAECAFQLCWNLTNVTIPNGVTTVADGTFVECYALVSLTLPNTLTSIGQQAFESTGLPGVTIPNSVTNIGEQAFEGCGELTSVFFQGNAPGPGSDLSVFSGDNNPTGYYLFGTTGWGPTFDGIPTVELGTALAMQVVEGQPGQLSVAAVIAAANAPTGTSLSVSLPSVTSSLGGALQLSGGVITYTPPAGFVGTDTFAYTISAAGGISAQGTITVTVAPGAPPPIAWTNTSGGNWSVANNWNLNRVPGPSDNVLITSNGTYLVTLDTSATINSLTLGAASGEQTISNSSFTLTLSNASIIGTNGIFGMSGGGFGGSGGLGVQGVFIWSGGQLDPGSSLTIATNALPPSFPGRAPRLAPVEEQQVVYRRAMATRWRLLDNLAGRRARRGLPGGNGRATGARSPPPPPARAHALFPAAG